MHLKIFGKSDPIRRYSPTAPCIAIVLREKYAENQKNVQMPKVSQITPKRIVKLIRVILVAKWGF